MFTTIVFDVDGTLIDSEEAILNSLQKVLQEEGHAYSQDDLRFALGIPGMDTLKQLEIANPERVLATWSETVLEFSDSVRLFEGAAEVVAQLAESPLRLGIVTSKTAQEVRHEFDPFGLSPHFDCIVSASDTEKHKPHPDPLLRCLETLGAEKEGALYIGDSIYDMQCAHSAGVPFALALWGSKTTERFEAADYILKQPVDVLELLKLHEEE
ncbi:phosphatase [Sporosarcina sp. NCCP-2716]|uniref:HAD family hydrolase n=1 Tax=Sporosarcina sp. NCCP-2716 TaxID=2943679 RepID=UPI0020401F76|nr:HAD family hydrolase [Sporosarcina sp. NCCP-2716]GKV68644.1 phosphatase [Sporosarcina sp. NCCP-2716]